MLDLIELIDYNVGYRWREQEWSAVGGKEYTGDECGFGALLLVTADAEIAVYWKYAIKHSLS